MFKYLFIFKNLKILKMNNKNQILSRMKTDVSNVYGGDHGL